MVVSIDWKTRIIYVPRNDLTLVQSSPSEIRNMDLNWFRVQLKNLEDSEVGMIYPDTHKHNSEVSLGGLVYARVIEIINDFTITFEDGQYAVNLVGANSNIGDKINVNQVSVRSNNSAGMTSAPALEYASYNNCITVDSSSIYSGTSYPVGTLQQPVNNLNDAILIASYRGFSTIHFISDYTFASNIYFEYTFKGVGKNFTNLFFNNTTFNNCVFERCKLSGALTNTSTIEANNCFIDNLQNVSLTAKSCVFFGITSLTANGASNFYDCYDGIPGIGKPTINVNTCTSLGIWNYQGALHLSHIETPGTVISFMIAQGRLFVDETDIEGNIIVKGMGDVFGSSGGTVLDLEGLITKETISEAVWDEPLINHVIPGSTGSTTAVSKFEGMIHVDSVLGVNSTIFPVGTHSYPTNNLTNALIIDTIYGFKRLHVKNTLSINQDISYYTFIAANSFATDNINLNNFILSHINFINLTVTGVLLDSHSVSFTNCFIEDITNITGEMYGGRLTGLIKVAPGGVLSGIEIVVEGDITVIDLQNAANTVVSLDVNSGIITFVNAVDTCLIELNLRGGEIVLDASCVGGDFYAEGYGTLYNDSNMTIKDNHLLALETIPPYILNSIASDYITNNTIGKAINDAAVGGGSGIDETGVHTALDSYTHKDLYKANISTLATKTDIQALNNPTVSDIVTAVWNHSKANQISSDVLFIKNIEGGKWEIVNNQMIFFKEDNITEIARFNLYDEEGVLANTNIFTRLRV